MLIHVINQFTDYTISCTSIKINLVGKMNKKCPRNDNALSAQGHMRSHHKLHVSTDLIEGKHRIIPEY